VKRWVPSGRSVIHGFLPPTRRSGPLPVHITIRGWILAVLVHWVVFILIPVLTIVVVRVFAPLTAPISVLSVPTSVPESTVSIPGLAGSVVDWWQGWDLQGARATDLPVHHHHPFHQAIPFRPALEKSASLRNFLPRSTRMCELFSASVNSFSNSFRRWRVWASWCWFVMMLMRFRDLRPWNGPDADDESSSSSEDSEVVFPAASCNRYT
jgi:hypothetical protein